MKRINSMVQVRPWNQYKKKPVKIIACLLTENVLVETLEGTMKGNKGDYLIQGIKGELYPCKLEIFKETYKRLRGKSITSFPTKTVKGK